MANLDETYEKPEFDWSAISVGDYKLDHSQNFFANKENNRNLNNENHQQQLIFSNCATPKLSRFKAEEQQEEEKEKELQVLQESKSLLELAAATSNLSVKESPATEPELAPAAGSPVQLDQQKEAVKIDDKEIKVEQRTIPNLVIYDDIKNMPEAEAAPVAARVRSTQWSPIHREHEGATASVPVPKAYAFKDLYECNRQQALRRQDEEERQARQFHSRPMPNFKAMHKRIEDMVVVHRVTVPRTPETIKYWQSCVERRRQAKRDQDKEEPVHSHSRHKTFNLHSEQRVRDRRDFDSAVQERQNQKKKEVNK